MATDPVPDAARPAQAEAPAKQSPSDTKTPMVKYALGGAAVLLGLTAVVFFRQQPAPPADPNLARLELLVQAVNTACVSNSEVENAAKVGADLSLLVEKIKGEGGITEYRKKHVGANMALPPELQPPENAKIRDCMGIYMPSIFKAMGIDIPAAQSRQDNKQDNTPNPLELRFSYRPAGNAKVELDNTLRVNLQMPRAIVDGVRLAQQPGDFYLYPIAYPAEGEKILGALVREVRASSLDAAPAPSRFCLRRPSPLEPSTEQHVHFDCTEGAGCAAHFPSPKWLEACPAEPAPKVTQGFSLFSQAHAAEAERRWVVPSAKTLAAHKDQFKGVGYTLVTLTTDAFREPSVIGVEVDIRVNGMPIHEDGLAPNLRPVPNDPSRPFSHTFALESLNFEGAQGGCEAIVATLRPRLAGGKTSTQAPAATLAYVALRDKAEDTVPLEGSGQGTVKWSARYIVPADEWSHEAFITSVQFKAGDETAMAAARQRAVTLKQAFDRLGVQHAGQRVVGVIRPPLTQTGQQLAYGLTAGVVQPSGQVRFTFSFKEADALANSLLAARSAQGAAAQQLIQREKYLYKAAGNAQRQSTPTPPGVCRHLRVT